MEPGGLSISWSIRGTEPDLLFHNGINQSTLLWYWAPTSCCSSPNQLIGAFGICVEWILHWASSVLIDYWHSYTEQSSISFRMIDPLGCVLCCVMESACISAWAWILHTGDSMESYHWIPLRPWIIILKDWQIYNSPRHQCQTWWTPVLLNCIAPE